MDKHKLLIKDLSLLLSGRDIKDIILIDNRVCSYMINMENGIPIKNFMGDKNDRSLESLTLYLKDRM